MKSLLIIVVITMLTEIISGYSIPELSIVAIRPRGFKVSIPHERGIQSFVFHGAVNAPLDGGRPGIYFGETKTPINNLWTFTESSVKLKIGDVINYWMNVQKDNHRYVKYDQSVVITDANFIEPTSSIPRVTANAAPATECNCTDTIIKEKTTEVHHHHHHYENNNMKEQSTPQPQDQQQQQQQQEQNKISQQNFDTIESQLNVTLIQLKSLHDKIAPLQTKIDSLVEVLQELLKDSTIGTKLILKGNPPPSGNLLESVRDFVTDKLELHDMYNNILSATQTPNGTVFEVQTVLDKKRILYRANERLLNSKQKVEDYTELNTDADRDGTFVIEGRINDK